MRDASEQFINYKYSEDDADYVPDEPKLHDYPCRFVLPKDKDRITH